MPDLPEAVTCRGETCRARIRFVPTQQGKRLPVNADPHPNGNVLIGENLYGEPVADVLARDAADRAFKTGSLLYMPHFSTCPDAKEFRHG